MKILNLIIILQVTICTSLLSQKEYFNWDYGSNYVISFDTPDGEPIILRKSIMETTAYSSSSISDSNGRFLFSADGVYAYNYLKSTPNKISYIDEDGAKRIVQMNGSYVAFQSAIIAKHPDNPNNYYIFTSACLEYRENNQFMYNPDSAYCYSIVELDKKKMKQILLK